MTIPGKPLMISVLTSAALALASGQALGALSYFGFDTYGGTWSDAEKSPTNNDDDLMCWAAGASNILDWTGWGHVGGGLDNADAIFGYFLDHWTDNGGNPYFGWDWWFDGSNESPDSAGWSQVDVPGGGFWTPPYDSEDYLAFTSQDNLAMLALDTLLHQGYGVTFSISGGGGHCITAWGFDYEDIGGERSYLGVHVTDSDDSKTLANPPDELRYYDVSYDDNDGAWYLQDYYGTNNWFISEVVALRQMPTAVPVPATAGLLGLGIALLAGMRRRDHQRPVKARSLRPPPTAHRPAPATWRRRPRS